MIPLQVLLVGPNTLGSTSEPAGQLLHAVLLLVVLGIVLVSCVDLGSGQVSHACLPAAAAADSAGVAVGAVAVHLDVHLG